MTAEDVVILNIAFLVLHLLYVQFNDVRHNLALCFCAWAILKDMRPPVAYATIIAAGFLCVVLTLLLIAAISSVGKFLVVVDHFTLADCLVEIKNGTVGVLSVRVR